MITYIKKPIKECPEIHGNLSMLSVLIVEKISSKLLIEKVKENDKQIPFCECGGVFKPDVVLFEMLSNLGEAVAEASKADLFLVIGLYRSPANLSRIQFSPKNLVIINYMDTPLDYRATMVVKEDIGTFLSEVCNYLRI